MYCTFERRLVITHTNVRPDDEAEVIVCQFLSPIFGLFPPTGWGGGAPDRNARRSDGRTQTRSSVS